MLVRFANAAKLNNQTEGKYKRQRSCRSETVSMAGKEKD